MVVVMVLVVVVVRVEVTEVAEVMVGGMGCDGSGNEPALF